MDGMVSHVFEESDQLHDEPIRSVMACIVTAVSSRMPRRPASSLALRSQAVAMLRSGQYLVDRLILHDIERERQRLALASTARFVNDHMQNIQSQGGRLRTEASLALLRRAVALAPEKGLIVEFGVASGTSLREIAALRLPAHGFDSFEGLPENWTSVNPAGSFAQQQIPEVGGAELHVGRFEDALPIFLATHPDPFAFVHFDADLYSSTRTVFELAEERFVPGTVLLFDEYFNYPGWEQHEHRAFMEFIDRTGRTFEYLSYNAQAEQVLARITGR